MLNKNLQIGMKVWDIVDGEGEIVSLCCHEDYPIRVKFLNGDNDSYDENYRRYKQSICQELFFSKPIITAETEPTFESYLIGTTLVVTPKNQIDDLGIYTGKCDYEDGSCVKFLGYVFNKDSFNIYSVGDEGKLSLVN